MEIPSKLGGKPVTKIEKWAFSDCKSITSITIPQSVEKIGDGAFNRCNNLTNITFEENSKLSIIEEDLFSCCSSLKSITIPNSVTIIKPSAFYYCRMLQSVYFDEKSQLSEIASHAFYFCDNLNDITFPLGLKNIGDYAFGACYSITNIIIPNTLTHIGEDAFGSCSSLVAITIPDNVISIGSEAFNYCKKLVIYAESPSKPAFWDSQWNPLDRPVYWSTPSFNVFDNWHYLKTTEESITITRYAGQEKTVSIPSFIDGIAVTDLGNKAFSSSESLMSLILPSSINHIGEKVFEDCSKLIILSDLSTKPDAWSSDWNDNAPVFWSTGTINVYNDFQYVIESGNVKIIRYIGEDSSITIPSQIDGKPVIIGDYAFSRCGNLIYVNIQEGISKIGIEAFNGSSRIAAIIIPESVNEIGRWAFDYIFAKIYTKHSNKPEEWDPNWISSSDRNPDWGVTEFGEYDGLIYAILSNEITVIRYIGKEQNVIIPSTIKERPVTKIGNNAFSYCTDLTSITIPESVNYIGERAFFYCINLASISIPDSVEEIKPYTFYNCENLISITFGKNSQLNFIGNDSFRGCISLTEIFIPDTVTHINYYAFQDCIKLKSVVFTENSQLEFLDSGVFSFCFSLTDIIIPQSTKTINYWVFNSCSSLKEIVIPQSVTYIGKQAFSQCDNIKIYVQAESKPSSWDDDWNHSQCPVEWGYKG